MKGDVVSQQLLMILIAIVVMMLEPCYIVGSCKLNFPALLLL